MRINTEGEKDFWRRKCEKKTKVEDKGNARQPNARAGGGVDDHSLPPTNQPASKKWQKRRVSRLKYLQIRSKRGGQGMYERREENRIGKKGEERMERKSKVLVVGATGFIGRRLVKASLGEGHPTYVLRRPEMGMEAEKMELLVEFKAAGAIMLHASFSDHSSLVSAVSKVDVVVSAMSGVTYRSHNILVQLQLVQAIKDAGNLKRFIPSEYGLDARRMGHALEPGRITFDEKLKVREAIEEANIPHTYMSSGCFGMYFVGNLCQLATLFPPQHQVLIYGDGKIKASFVDEDDIATYVMKAVDDPRTLNKTIYIRPPRNIVSQGELVDMWEKMSGVELQKVHISEHDFLSTIKEKDYHTQVGAGHFYHIFYEGCLTNFEVGDDEDASKLYPEVEYTDVEHYLQRYIDI